MRTGDDLERALENADRRGYPAYKSLAGTYELENFDLSVDHVSGDPFAAPSRLSAFVPAEIAGWPADLYDTPWRRTAFEDFLVRRFSRELARASFQVGGSGRSGLLATSRPGPEVLERSAAEVRAGDVLLRFEAGLPARGRTVDGRAAARILLDLVPACVARALIADEAGARGARAAADLADDQHALRGELERRGLVAFVADGSVLPRASGVSARPLAGAIPFRSPESVAVELDLPRRGRVRGMGVRRGVTIIVGGGYHGKSTLLQALQAGVYDHVAGDGRELVATDATAVKLRAEDGRPVRGADISLFIGELPDGRDTHRFSTADASGSTSQAASCIEAVQAGCRALLIDEDTSATNFMVRDRVMEAVVARGDEPITPFAERVRDLWERAGVSSVIVVGSSGAFFSVADAVVQMERYEAVDVTERARAVCREIGADATRRAGGFAMPAAAAAIALEGLDEGSGRAGRGGGRGPRGGGRERGGRPFRLKARSRGLDEIEVGRGGADLRLVEQLVDPEQAAAIAQMVRAAAERGMLAGGLDAHGIAHALIDLVRDEGWDALAEHGAAGCGLALPRAAEIAAALARWRAEG